MKGVGRVVFCGSVYWSRRWIDNPGPPRPGIIRVMPRNGRLLVTEIEASVLRMR